MKRFFKYSNHWAHLIKILSIVPAISLLSYMAYAHPDLSLGLALLSSWPAALLIIFSFTSVGSVRLGAVTEQKPLWQWMGGILLIQLVIAYLLLSQSLAFMGFGPDFIKGTVSPHFAWTVIKDYSLNQWGIFPWGVYLLWGISLAFFTYNKGGVPFHHRHSAVFWRGAMGSVVKLGTEMMVIGATILVSTLTLASAFILIYQGIRLYFQWPDYFQTLLPDSFIYSFAFFILLFVITRKKMRQWVRGGATMSHLLWLSLGIALLLLTISSFFGELVRIFSSSPLPFQTCTCVKRYEQQGPDLRFAIVFWSWLLIWAPLVGSLIARLSIGRTIRQVVMAVMLVPMIIYIVLNISSFQYLNNLNYLKLPEVCFFMGILIFVICLLVFKHKKTSQFFAAGFMPVPKTVKSGVLSLEEGTKIHGLSYFGQRIILAPLGILFLHTMGGWLLVQVPIVILGLFLILKTSLCMLWALVYQLFKDFRTLH